MYMPPLRITAAVVVLAGGVAMSAGCGLITHAASCTKVANTIASVSRTAATQLNNPSAIEATYSNGATKIRSEDSGLNGSQKAGADKVADDMDTASSDFKSGGLESGSNAMSQIATDTGAFGQACTS